MRKYICISKTCIILFHHFLSLVRFHVDTYLVGRLTLILTWKGRTAVSPALLKPLVFLSHTLVTFDMHGEMLKKSAAKEKRWKGVKGAFFAPRSSVVKSYSDNVTYTLRFPMALQLSRINHNIEFFIRNSTLDFCKVVYFHFRSCCSHCA